MSTIRPEDVEHIARLSRLELSEEEKKKFAHELTSILSYVEKLNELDTSEVEATRQVTDAENVLRPDRREDSTVSQREALLAQIPEREGDGVKVPPVLQ